MNLIYIVQIEMHKCFRPGDIVLAKVQSLGDTQSYILNTTENELGVIIAKSEAGMFVFFWFGILCRNIFLVILLLFRLDH